MTNPAGRGLVALSFLFVVVAVVAGLLAWYAFAIALDDVLGTCLALIAAGALVAAIAARGRT